MLKVQWLQVELLRAGYHKIETNLEQYSLFYKNNQGNIQGVFLVKINETQRVTAEQMHHIHAQVYRILQNFGNNPAFMTVVAGENISRLKDAFKDLPMCWLWDVSDGRLLIYENQPSTYFGLEEILRGNAGRNEGYRRSFWNKNRPKAIMNATMIVINIVVFIVLELTGSTLDTQFMLDHGAAYAPWILEYNAYWRLFTSMFMHFGISHLGNNMLVLFLLGDNVERAVGHWRYVVIYLMSGLAGSCLSFVGALVSRNFAVCAGASGAIFGIIGALFYIVAVNRGRLEDMTTRKLGILIAVSLYHGLTSSGVDNLAHIGGLAGGALLALVLYERKGKTSI